MNLVYATVFNSSLLLPIQRCERKQRHDLTALQKKNIPKKKEKNIQIASESYKPI